MRGEYPTIMLYLSINAGSPPLARGILCRIQVGEYGGGITPACAGNTDRSKFSCPLGRDHPRLRGEYQKHVSIMKTGPGSPPLARGILVDISIQSLHEGITPACAGNTSGRDADDPVRWDHPRLRGEYSKRLENCAESTGSPPLARGIPGRNEKI